MSNDLRMTTETVPEEEIKVRCCRLTTLSSKTTIIIRLIS